MLLFCIILLVLDDENIKSEDSPENYDRCGSWFSPLYKFACTHVFEYLMSGSSPW